MTTANISDIAQALAAVATILSLIFVGVQIRQNTRATRAAAHHNVSDSLNQLNLMFAGDGEVTNICLTGMQDRKALSPEEKWRFDSMMRAYMHVCETMFVQTELGSGDDSIRLAEEEGIRAMMASPGSREWWDENPYGFCAEFRSYVEGLAPPKPPAS
jgi:hypothetical protein